MPDAKPPYGLHEVSPGSADHAVIVLHGLRQTEHDMRPFAKAIARTLPGPRILTYGYDYNQGLAYNGARLANQLHDEVPETRIDLLGYSMGGLVARLAASEEEISNINTVITLATPNRGSLSNTELTTLGQLGRKALEIISPLIPRSEGVKDLTRAREIMRRRRQRLMNGDRTFTLNGDRRRYVSIPALWYSKDKAFFELGPSFTMSGLTTAFKAAGLKVKLESMKKSHDGIVTENSNNLALTDGNDWAEFHLVRPGDSGAPALCHAVVEACDQHDHISIVRFDDQLPSSAANNDAIVSLVCALIDTADWRDLKAHHPELKHARLHPFAV